MPELMEARSPIRVAFLPPLPLSTTNARCRRMQHQNRTKLFSRLRSRAVIASSARTTSVVDTSQQTIRFENLFPDPATATVLTPENETASLIEHVKSRNAAGETVLLGWLRHFGCSLCKKQTSDWISIKPQLEDCGKVCITLIGNGPPRHAVEFINEMNWTGCLFTDPDRRTYKALQFRARLLDTFNLPALAKVITSFREGNKQTWKRIPTDAFQQGGALVVDKNGIVRVFHADAFAGDHFQKDQIVKEICDMVQ